MPDECMNRHCGGGGVMYLPHCLGIDKSLKGKYCVVTYMFYDGYSEVDANDIDLEGYVKGWVLEQFLKKESVWIKK